jgi:hypothetical protein
MGTAYESQELAFWLDSQLRAGKSRPVNLENTLSFRPHCTAHPHPHKPRASHAPWFLGLLTEIPFLRMRRLWRLRHADDLLRRAPCGGQGLQPGHAVRGVGCVSGHRQRGAERPARRSLPAPCGHLFAASRELLERAAWGRAGRAPVPRVGRPPASTWGQATAYDGWATRTTSEKGYQRLQESLARDGRP